MVKYLVAFIILINISCNKSNDTSVACFKGKLVLKGICMNYVIQITEGICVNGIAPGYIETDNTKALREDIERNKSILDRIPAKRWGTPDDFKGPVVFLASEASNYVNGAMLLVDGGWMAR